MQVLTADRYRIVRQPVFFHLLFPALSHISVFFLLSLSVCLSLSLSLSNEKNMRSDRIVGSEASLLFKEIMTDRPTNQQTDMSDYMEVTHPRI